MAFDLKPRAAAAAGRFFGTSGGRSRPDTNHCARPYPTDVAQSLAVPGRTLPMSHTPGPYRAAVEKSLAVPGRTRPMSHTPRPYRAPGRRRKVPGRTRPYPTVPDRCPTLPGRTGPQWKSPWQAAHWKSPWPYPAHVSFEESTVHIVLITPVMGGLSRFYCIT